MLADAFEILCESEFAVFDLGGERLPNAEIEKSYKPIVTLYTWSQR